jgi:peroxiredoxin
MSRLTPLLLVALSFAGASYAADPPRRAPGFALPDGKMKIYDLYDYRGKPVLLEFMSTTCEHCAEFTAVIDKVLQKYGERIQVLSVANPPDNTATVGRFAAARKITYPVLFDSGQAAYSYILRPTFDLPQIFLIDAQGIIQRQIGYSPATRNFFEGNGLMPEIDRMFAGSAAPASKKK